MHISAGGGGSTPMSRLALVRSAEPSRIRDAADNWRRLADTLDEVERQLEGEAQRRLTSSWSGTSADHAQQAFAQLAAQVRSRRENVEYSARYLDDTASAVEEAQQTHQDLETRDIPSSPDPTMVTGDNVTAQDELNYTRAERAHTAAVDKRDAEAEVAYSKLARRFESNGQEIATTNNAKDVRTSPPSGSDGETGGGGSAPTSSTYASGPTGSGPGPSATTFAGGGLTGGVPASYASADGTVAGNVPTTSSQEAVDAMTGDEAGGAEAIGGAGVGTTGGALAGGAGALGAVRGGSLGGAVRGGSARGANALGSGGLRGSGVLGSAGSAGARNVGSSSMRGVGSLGATPGATGTTGATGTRGTSGATGTGARGTGATGATGGTRGAAGMRGGMVGGSPMTGGSGSTGNSSGARYGNPRVTGSTPASTSGTNTGSTAARTGATGAGARGTGGAMHPGATGAHGGAPGGQGNNRSQDRGRPLSSEDEWLDDEGPSAPPVLR
jgi:hypothetical protein